jgi:hypothetical protein
MGPLPKDENLNTIDSKLQLRRNIKSRCQNDLPVNAGLKRCFIDGKHDLPQIRLRRGAGFFEIQEIQGGSYEQQNYSSGN